MNQFDQVPKIKASSIVQLKQQIYSLQNCKELQISFDSIQEATPIHQITFDGPLLICEKLKLSITSEVNGTQKDFDQFCYQLQESLKKLQVLQFRYYSKFILNIDSLLAFVRQLKEVQLNLQDFSKIVLKEEQNYQDYQIEYLSLNLFNTTFKDNVRGLVKFINSLNKLKYLKLFIDKQQNIKILEEFKNKNIQVDLVLRKVDYEFCDQLKSIVDQQQIKLEKIFFHSILIGWYLEKIKLGKNCHINQTREEYRNYFRVILEQQNRVNIHLLDKIDIKLLKKSDSLVQQIKDQIKVSITFNIDFFQFKSIFEQVISKTHQAYSNIIIEHSTSYQFNIHKKNSFWYIQFQSSSEQYLKCLTYTKDHLNNLQLKMSSQLNQDSQDEIFLIKIYKILIQFKYLIFFKMESYYYIQQQTLQIPSSNIIQQKSQDRLRFFAFRKLIYDLVPIPQQIFYDLIEDN